jgi:hypothetical protein
VGLPDIAYRRHLFGRFTLTSTKQQQRIPIRGREPVAR